MEPQVHGPIVPPEMLRPRPKKSWLLPAAGGLAAGTVLGLAIGLAAGGGAVVTGGAASAPGLNQEAIDRALDACVIDAEGYTILDGGAAIELDTKGEDIFDTGTTDYTAYICMLTELGVPESTQQKIGRTRALDGTQSDSWGNMQASWSYHPDHGANVLIEGVETK